MGDLQILFAEVSDSLSLQSPTLDEFVVYKLLQALSGEKYYNKCIRIPSTGESSKISPESVKMLMTHSAEVVIDDCIQELARGGGKQEESQLISFCFVVLIATRL